MKIKIFLLLFIFMIGTSVVFTNCGVQGFQVQTLGDAQLNSFTAGSCEAELLDQYEKSLHPFFSNSTRCLNCHSGSGPGVGSFANSNPQVSMKSALEIGVSHLLDQAISNHQPGYTGSQNSTSILNISTRWESAYLKYQECTSVKTIDPSIVQSKSINLNIPVNLSQTTFQSLEFDLTKSSSPVPLIVKLDVRLLALNGKVVGYEFKAPQGRLLSAGNDLRVLSLMFYLNGIKQNNMTTYTNLQVTVNSVNFMQLIAQSESAASVRVPLPGDYVAIELQSSVANPGGVTNPTPVPTVNPTPAPNGGDVPTYLQLSSAGGIFQQRCFNCHNSTRSFGSLDLTSYAKAKVAAANIRSRINNAGNPMPTGGLMSSSERNTVNAWIDGKTPP